jgi:spermidine/putrescine transport system permease protein
VHLRTHRPPAKDRPNEHVYPRVQGGGCGPAAAVGYRFLLVPYSILFCYSFWSVSPLQVIVHSWSFDNYRELVHNPIYALVLFRSMRIAATVTLLALALGYPLAYCLIVLRDETQRPAVSIGDHSAVGELPGARLRLENDPGQRWCAKRLPAIFSLHPPSVGFFLYSPFAVILTLTHIYTPFTFLPIYASLEHIPRNLVEASHDLGASPLRTFWRVVFPLSIPGVLAGATFAFVLTLGDFLAPLLVGGPSGIMISNIVVSLFGAAYNWPLGAAISLCMLLLVVGLLAGVERLEKKLSYS